MGRITSERADGRQTRLATPHADSFASPSASPPYINALPLRLRYGNCYSDVYVDADAIHTTFTPTATATLYADGDLATRIYPDTATCYVYSPGTLAAQLHLPRQPRLH